MINEINEGVMPVAQDVRKERFEIILTINDNIICQRYFKINGLKNNPFKSRKFRNAIEYCANLIQNDLKLKSNLYNCYTAPQIFNNVEEFQNWIPSHYLRVPEYVLFRDTKLVYVWDGEKLKLYDKRFNVSDYIATDEEIVPNDIKFSFLDDGNVIYSKIWDGNAYPRFIRNNIDLSNSKNRYDSNVKPYESYLIKLLTKDREDLIPMIINEICDVCSSEPKVKVENNTNNTNNTNNE